MAIFFIGVDGGASKTRVVIENANGQQLGQQLAGPGSIRLSIADTWTTIISACNAILSKHGLSLADKAHEFHAGIGVAGIEIPSARAAFLQYAHPFHSAQFTSDAHIACLAAHAERDGGIIIVGTGVIGFQCVGGRPHRVGGWGFPHDDAGSGAWIGLQAIAATVTAYDGRKPVSALSQAMIEHFKDFSSLVEWSNAASATTFATLAPLVLRLQQKKCPVATSILQEAARHIELVHTAMTQQAEKSLPCILLGGLAPSIYPFLSQITREWVREGDAIAPEHGGIVLARAALAAKTQGVG